MPKLSTAQKAVKKNAKTLRSLNIEEADDGSFIIQQNRENADGDWKPPKKFTAPDEKGALAIIKKFL